MLFLRLVGPVTRPSCIARAAAFGRDFPAADHEGRRGRHPPVGSDHHRVGRHEADAGDDLELYGSEIAVDFVDRLRGQVKFDGVDALIEQMSADVAAAKQRLGVA